MNEHVMPNSSIERTCNIRLRLLSHAAHVKRWSPTLRSAARRESITLGERLAVALVSIIAAGFTVAFFWFVVFFAGGIVTTEYAKTTIFWGVVASLGAGVAGFFLGGERAAHWFGILWGTQEPTEKQLGLALGFIILICGVIVFVSLT